MATHQQLFDAAWNGLKGQGFMRTDRFRTNYAPALNSAEGLGCAFWHAEQAFPGDRWVDVPFSEFITCHNTATSPPDMERRFREYAAKYGLTIPGDDTWAREQVAKVTEPAKDVEPDDDLFVTEVVSHVQHMLGRPL